MVAIATGFAGNQESIELDSSPNSGKRRRKRCGSPVWHHADLVEPAVMH